MGNTPDYKNKLSRNALKDDVSNILSWKLQLRVQNLVLFRDVKKASS